MVRRAFRQFLGELLESDKSSEGVSFIRQVFTEASCAKEWREEVVIALLGSSCALDALHQTQDFWTDASGESLRMLCHLLRIAYRGKAQAETEPERPFGPGWNALMTFIHEHRLRRRTTGAPACAPGSPPSRKPSPPTSGPNSNRSPFNSHPLVLSKPGEDGSISNDYLSDFHVAPQQIARWSRRL